MESLFLLPSKEGGGGKIWMENSITFNVFLLKPSLGFRKTENLLSEKVNSRFRCSISVFKYEDAKHEIERKTAEPDQRKY